LILKYSLNFYLVAKYSTFGTTVHGGGGGQYKTKVFSNAFLHLEGHVHYGQFKDNYFNLGFAYRDDLHGSEPLEGLIWFFEIDKDYEVSFYYKSFGDLKEIVCPYHAEEGLLCSKILEEVLCMLQSRKLKVFKIFCLKNN